MEFTMRVHMDTAAFEEDATGELVRILREVADGVQIDNSDVCVDRRGNTVGGWQINE